MIVLLTIILIDKIHSKRLCLFLFSILVVSTIGNFFTETTFKQFFKKRDVHKPDLKSVFLKINKSSDLYVTLNLEKTYLDKNEISNAFENYLKNYSKIDNLETEYFNYLVKDQKNYPKKVWVICLNDLNGSNCEIPEKFINFKIIKESSFNSVNLKLVEKSV